MIQKFRHKGLKRLFEEGEAKGIHPDRLEKLENILFVESRPETGRYELARFQIAPPQR